MTEDPMTNTKAIKMFMEQDGGRPTTLKELKELTMSSRKELGRLCAEALGVDIDNQ